VPFAHRPDVRIWWDQSGTGDPVLLIMGHAYRAGVWHRTVPELAASYRVIRFDNRGAGRSSDPPGPYSVRMMADDALAVLNDLDPQDLVIASMWMADEKAPASRY
jgi:3-oxoadipate enol-lactonase